MDGPLSDEPRSPHELVNPPDLMTPSGFSHAVVAAEGRLVFLGGQTGHNRDGLLVSEDLVEQLDTALANLVRALAAADGRPEHLVQMTIYVTDADVYRHSLEKIGHVYRQHLGKHYPAVALFEVSSLFDPRAKVEVVAIAVLPERRPRPPAS